MRRKMNKLFIALTFVGLAIALVRVNACAAGNLAIDGTGNLFAASSSSHSIFKFTPDGKKSTFASRVSPDKMVLDGAGNLFVAEEHFQEDRHADVIFEIHTGRKEKHVRLRTRRTFGAWPLTERAICLWWRNIFRNSMTSRRSSNSHRTERRARSLSPPGVLWYCDIAVDGAGNLFVVDFVRNAGSSILKFTPDGKQSTFASGVSTRDYGVDILGLDDNSNLFVAVFEGDAGSSLLKFTPDGTKSMLASGLGEPVDPTFDRRAISSWGIKSAIRSLHSRPMERRAPSPPAPALAAWPLTQQAISLFWRAAVSYFSNLHRTEPEAPLLPTEFHRTNGGNISVPLMVMTLAL